MRPRDWFSVGVRLLGVWFSTRGVTDLLTAGTYVLGLAPKALTDRHDDLRTGVTYNLWYAAGTLALAIYLVFGAEHLTRWAFQEPTLPIDDDGSGDSE
jgi:hypothetical protein